MGEAASLQHTLTAEQSVVVAARAECITLRSEVNFLKASADHGEQAAAAQVHEVVRNAQLQARAEVSPQRGECLGSK
jgi:hypothetical protein